MIKSISPKEAYEMITKNDDIYIIDVRTPEEYKEGHIKNAILINIYNTEEFKDKINKLDKSKTYLVYCRSGVRSLKACEIMEKYGFKNIYNLDGGIMAWINNGFPIEK